MKVSLPRRHVVTSEFRDALTALCRAKGLDVKHAWPLATCKRLASDEAKKFEDARTDAVERHGIGMPDTSAASIRQFNKEMVALLSETVELPFDAGSATPDEGTLTGDVLEQVMEFVKRPNPTAL